VTRIAGANIPVEKRVVISLTYIYGIGKKSAQDICNLVAIDIKKRVKDLTDQELVALRNIIEGKYLVEGDLRREIKLNIQKKKDIKSYQGMRHIQRLPVHGQNTRSNARTWKGPAVAIPNKKKATK